MMRNELPGRICRRGIGARSLLCVAAAMISLLGAPTLPLAHGDPWTTSTQIPVVVNIYNGSITPAQVDAAIKEANKLLKQVDTKLVVVKTNNPPGEGNGDNGDGRFTEAERTKMRTYGGKELKKLKNEKGIKLSFGQDPKAETPGRAAGISHAPAGGPPNGEAGDPTIILTRTTDADTGNTIAHELGHVMGITGDYNNPNRIMDARGRGSKFSAAEIAQMKNFKYKFGKCATQWSEAFPATKDKTQFGATTDANGDAGDKGGVANYYDLHQVYLTSAVELEDIDAQIDVPGVLPEDEWIDATYALGFDIDADVGTGITYGGYDGIDRIVFIQASGQVDMGTFTIVGGVEDAISGFVELLPDTPRFATIMEIADFEVGTEPSGTAFYFRIPKFLLDLTAMDAPVVATAGTLGIIYDTTDDLTFDSDRWADDPTLTTFGTGVPEPGMPYSYQIEGLQPYSTYQLFLDDILVASDVLDGGGGAGGSFDFPMDMTNTELHFLTAQDETGEFAYSMTCPKACATCLGDFDESGTVNMGDIPPYVDILVDGFSPIGNPACGEMNMTSLLDGRGIATMIDLVLANSGSGTPCPDEICVMPGEDCWSIPCDGESEIALGEGEIPPDFFGPGSDPFGGTIPFGEKDTPLVKSLRTMRLDPLCFGPPPFDASTPIEIVELDIESCSPITVTYDGGAVEELWDVAMILSTMPAPFGTMNVTRTHENGGIYNSNLFVQPRYMFTKVDDPMEFREWDTGVQGMPPIQLDAVEVPWLFDEQSGNVCDPDFAPGYQEAEGGGTCCTQVCHESLGGPGLHSLCAYPPYCIELCGESVLIEPGVFCFETFCGRSEFDFCATPLPADFFGPGSEPFEGTVALMGADGMDTIFERLDVAYLSGSLPSTADVPIRLNHLMLIGCEPITVMINGEPTVWDVGVELPGWSQAGTMSITKTHENGGTYTVDLLVEPVFVFYGYAPPHDELYWDPSDQGVPPWHFLTVDSSPWVHSLEGGFYVHHCDSATNFIPGVLEDPPGGPQCAHYVAMSAPEWLHESIEREPSDICTGGACCMPGGGCELTPDEAVCVVDFGGEYMGDGTCCDDLDGDNLADVFESHSCCYGIWTGNPCSTGTSPFDPDTDGDGMLDGDEILGGTDPCNPAG